MDPKNLFGYFNLKTCQDQQNKSATDSSKDCAQLAGTQPNEDQIGILTTGSSKMQTTGRMVVMANTQP